VATITVTALIIGVVSGAESLAAASERTDAGVLASEPLPSGPLGSQALDEAATPPPGLDEANEPTSGEQPTSTEEPASTPAPTTEVTDLPRPPGVGVFDEIERSATIDRERSATADDDANDSDQSETGEHDGRERTDSLGPVAPTPGVVHLTFDDGPHRTYTPAVLDILARHDARATFFVVGSQVEAHPELVERIVAEGHTLANHSWHHEDLAPLTRAEFDRNVGLTQELLGPHATSCLRPPFGSVGPNTRAWARDLGLELVLWDVDTYDWQQPDAETITRMIVRGAESGSVILLHDAGGDRTQTVAALDRALDQLSGRGLSFEPVCVPS
jgi:peptidoglycan/xylan/chitin deacetylase (PgdA/CDA1 family)